MSKISPFDEVHYHALQWTIFNLTGAILLGGEKFFFGLSPCPIENPGSLLAERYKKIITRDVSLCQAGYYQTSDMMFPLAKWLSEIPLLAADINAIRERMTYNQWKLPFAADQYPKYYRRTYHWQSDGYLSADSANRYDVSAELQLRGAAQMIRRLCIPYLSPLEDRKSRLLEIGCGTGTLLPTLAKAYPGAKVVGMDLSPYYIDKARNLTLTNPSIELLIANGYDTGLPDCYFDGIVSVFLLHELPGSLRRRLFAECYRLLKPGGVLVLADAIQDSDDLFMATYLKWILERFHEPYFVQYMKAPVEGELTDIGFKAGKPESYFLAKYFVARK